jgi:hypothetical protein
MKKIFIAFSLLMALGSFAQNSPRTSADSASGKTDSSSITIHKDPRLDLLVNKQIQINEEISRETRKSGKGFRIMVISTISRDEAMAAKTTIILFLN